MNPKVTIGIPTGGSVIFDFALSLAKLSAYYSDKYVLDGIQYASGCYLHDNRNRIVSNFLKTSSEWLLFIDTDIVFSVDIIDKLLDINSKHNALIVGGWYMNMIQGKYLPMLYRKKEDVFTCILPSMNQDFSVDAIGLGCVMIHREVFEKLDKQTGQSWFYFDETEDKKLISEDIVFCLNARRQGYEIWVDSNLKLKHMKIGDI